MKKLSEELNKRFAPRPMREDEYFDEGDGLFYCMHCHTPRQACVSVLDKWFCPDALCQCQKEQREKEAGRRKRQDFLDEVSRLKASGLQDKALRHCTFAHDLGYNPEIKKAHSYVDHWQEMKQKNTGLLIWGNVGTGKSFIAGCIANALLDKGIPVLMTNYDWVLECCIPLKVNNQNIREWKAASHLRETKALLSAAQA
jgi:DNA replication protein DnaC